MAIVGTTKHHDLKIYDPVMNSVIDTTELTTGAAKTPFLYVDQRFLLISGIAANSVTRYDIGLDPPSLIETTSTGISMKGIFGDGRYLWVITSTGVISQIDPVFMTTIGTISLSASTYQGLTGDGRFLWTNDTVAKTAQRIDVSTGSQMVEWTTPADFGDWHCDGRFMYIVSGTSLGGHCLFDQYDIFKGTKIGSQNAFALTTAGDVPYGLCGDGRFYYIMTARVTTP